MSDIDNLTFSESLNDPADAEAHTSHQAVTLATASSELKAKWKGSLLQRRKEIAEIAAQEQVKNLQCDETKYRVSWPPFR